MDRHTTITLRTSGPSATFVAMAHDGRHIEDENRFYEEVGRLAQVLGGPRRLANSSAGDGWPTRGLYLFFEEGEVRRDGSHRITRIGTHALRQQSKTTLWGRLAQHRGQVSGRNPGGGNHRGSIFRLHVGAALIDRDARPSGLQQSWLSTKCDPAWAQEEDDLERAVSLYIGRMPFVWLAIPTNPDGTNDRGYLERNAIGLLSVLSGGRERPSQDWLGLGASNPKIAPSGLWNVNHVDEGYDPTFLDHLSELIDRMPVAQ